MLFLPYINLVLIIVKLCTYMIFNIGECVYFKIERIDVKPIPTKLPIF
jgi:hypothetical protein